MSKIHSTSESWHFIKQSKSYIDDRQTSWLPPLGYSPQFAAFNRILFAVGHRVLQHFYVLMVDNSVTRSFFIAKKRGTKPNDT